mmetsp:Transcript_63830/g.178602  ORF Transcript_63830/g.178602 Transcript_63830/m.178602 type:complete len:288 (-) Transcript_63830:113-976(-)
MQALRGGAFRARRSCAQGHSHCLPRTYGCEAGGLAPVAGARWHPCSGLVCVVRAARGRAVRVETGALGQCGDSFCVYDIKAATGTRGAHILAGGAIPKVLDRGRSARRVHPGPQGGPRQWRSEVHRHGPRSFVVCGHPHLWARGGRRSGAHAGDDVRLQVRRVRPQPGRPRCSPRLRTRGRPGSRLFSRMPGVEAKEARSCGRPEESASFAGASADGVVLHEQGARTSGDVPMVRRCDDPARHNGLVAVHGRGPLRRGVAASARPELVGGAPCGLTLRLGHSVSDDA